MLRGVALGYGGFDARRIRALLLAGQRSKALAELEPLIGYDMPPACGEWRPARVA